MHKPTPIEESIYALELAQKQYAFNSPQAQAIAVAIQALLQVEEAN